MVPVCWHIYDKMRILKTKTDNLEFEQFWGAETPVYAILSHTWGKDEVTFQDVQSGISYDSARAGYAKVDGIRTVAAAYGLDYVWIDTCCIDKSSSAELSEAINSMYEWYRKSTLCFAYLADVNDCDEDNDTCPDDGMFCNIQEVEQAETSIDATMAEGADESLSLDEDISFSSSVNDVGGSLADSRWFTRGWTLQELIAPSVVVFLDANWQELGTKSSLQAELSKITGIPEKVLLGCDPSTESIAQRMSWASKRQTSRVEDKAYCLLGLFGINMPMLYGEGDKAFTRLQEEIIKISDDHTIFAWSVNHDDASDEQASSDSAITSITPLSPLAPEPRVYYGTAHAVPLQSSSQLVDAITSNSKGIRLQVRLIPNHPKHGTVAILPCTSIIMGKLYFYGIAVRDVSFPRTPGEIFDKTTNELTIIRAVDVPSGKYPIRHIYIQHSRQKHQYFPFINVAGKGYANLMEKLVHTGLRLDPQASYAADALCAAATQGHNMAVKWLLDRGVSPTAQSLEGALKGGHVETARTLLREGGFSVDENILKVESCCHESVLMLLLGNLSDVSTDGGDSKMLIELVLGLALSIGSTLVLEAWFEKGFHPSDKVLQNVSKRGPLMRNLFLSRGYQLDSGDEIFLKD